MREDQLITLLEIQEEVADAFIEECQPSKWPKMDTRQNRGDRYWFKQNAAASLKLVAQIESVRAHRAARAANGQVGENDGDADDRMLKRVEKQAAALMERAGIKGHAKK